MNIHRFNRKVDGKEFREMINDIAGKDCDKVFYLDGYDNAIIGFVDTDFDTVPHIVYDYEMMVEVALEHESQQEYNKDASDEEILSDALDAVEDASRSIQCRNGLPKGAKEPIILEPIKDVFVEEE